MFSFGLKDVGSRPHHFNRRRAAGHVCGPVVADLPNTWPPIDDDGVYDVGVADDLCLAKYFGDNSP